MAGNTQMIQGEYSAGVQNLEMRLKMSKEIYGDTHGETALALVDLGDSVGRLRDPKQATYLKQAMVIQETAFPADHPDRAQILRAYGSWLKTVQDSEGEAVELLEEALRIQRLAYGPEHRETYDTLYLLANHYSAVERFEESKAAFDELLKIGESFLGENHPKHGSALWNYGLLLQDQGNLEMAEHFFLKSIEIEAELPGRPMHKAINLSGLGEILHRQGKLKEAEAHHRDALGIMDGIEGSERAYERGFFAFELGKVLQDAGRFEEALNSYDAALGYFGDFGGFVADARVHCRAKRDEVIEQI